MSGIFGIFNLSGKPIAQPDLDRMVASMAYWGPDGKKTWRENDVGLGQLMLYSTPESKYESLPRKSICGNYVITANCRIDNRDQLLKIFNFPFSDHPYTPDSALILKAYEKWEEDCPDHLLGDWSFAIWDIQKQKLFIARDHHGNTALYYFHCSRFFVFSSSLKGIFSVTGIPILLNEMKVAQILVSWPEYGASTVYKNIYRLPPAHCMDVSRDNIKISQYWNLENTSSLYYASDQEYVDAFREIFSEAVRCRLRSSKPVGLTLSGGLDSGSVAALAAREMRPKQKSIKAFSSIPLYDVRNLVDQNRMGDETSLIDAMVDHTGNIDLTYIRAENFSPVMGIRRSLHLHEEPGHAACNAYWILAIMKAASNSGIGSLLIGQGGNATISWDGAGYFAQLARQLRWRTMWKELYSWNKAKNQRFFRTVASQVILPVLPWFMRKYINFFLSGRNPWKEYSAINQNFADSLDLTKRMYDCGHDPLFGKKSDTRQNRYNFILPGKDIVGCLRQEMGAGFNMDIRDPTYDKRVMEYCLSIPDDQYLRNGIDRFLIRRAMQEFMPSEVRLNTRRGYQAADITIRLHKNRDEFKSALDDISQSESARYILDIAKMRLIFSELGHNLNSEKTFQAVTILTRGLMTGLFIVNYENMRIK